MNIGVRSATAVTLILAVSACGGGEAVTGVGMPGGGGSTGLTSSTKAISDLGATSFANGATAVSALQNGTTFSGTGNSLSQQKNGSGFGVGLARRDIDIATTSDINVLDITYGGQTYRAISSDNGNTYRVDQGGKSLFFAPAHRQTNASLGFLTYGDIGVAVTQGSGEVADFVFGYKTDPTVVNARSATANYFGGTNFKVATTTKGNAIGTGSVALTADFTNSTVQGTITGGYTEFGSAVRFPIDITLNQGAITGNGFSGTLGLTPSQFGSTSTSNATYSGSFFGPTADEVGGTFSAEGSGLTKDTVIQGAFTGVEN